MNAPSSATERALVVGEALVDVVTEAPGVREYAGGSPANVAVALGRLGRAVTLATQLASDRYGRLLREHLAASGVEVVAAPAARTSSAIARIGDSGAASYEFDIVWDPQFDRLPDAVVVHVGSFSAVTGDRVAELVEAGRSGATVSYDVNVRPALMGEPATARGRIERLVGLAHVVKASDEDLEWLSPDRPVDETARALLGLGPAAVLVTRGAQGATVFTGSRRLDIEASAVEVVDTIGAGDTFSAGLLHGLWDAGVLGTDLSSVDDQTWSEVGSFAAWLAAQTASRPGADPPWLGHPAPTPTS